MKTRWGRGTVPSFLTSVDRSSSRIMKLTFHKQVTYYISASEHSYWVQDCPLFTPLSKARIHLSNKRGCIHRTSRPTLPTSILLQQSLKLSHSCRVAAYNTPTTEPISPQGAGFLYSVWTQKWLMKSQGLMCLYCNE